MSEQVQQTQTQDSRLGGIAWALALVPLILLGIIAALIVTTEGGLSELSGPPIEQVSIQRIILPEPGRIVVEVVNDGPQDVTIPQVLVDEAYWQFTAEPSTTIPRFGRATFTIPYPWVAEEAHEVVLVTELGGTFAGEIAVAVESPAPSTDLFARFGLVGFYVGIIPVLLGMLWYPFMRRLGTQGMNFVLSLTIGLLVFLAVGTWLDAQEFAAELPQFWQGVPMVIFIALITLGVLIAVSSVRQGQESTPLGISYRIALGIGLHNLGEGLAIGAAFALGEAALGTFLILGFTLHNITEGVGIAAPIVRKNPGLQHFGLLLLLAGGPAVLGTWIGGFAFSPILATIFLAIGVGAILQVVWEVGKLIARDSTRIGLPIINWVNLSGVTVGIAIMYFTAFLVKF
ncbi:MAG: metal transporter [Anaerolineaceae bacterium]|nr:metal transporter [Anaerolineaceae bacterium]